MTLLAEGDFIYPFVPNALFYLFATLTCVFAVAVLFTSNIVRMAFYLTLSLGATAGLFMVAGAQFVGAMQFMIYVGGTLVLLIFGVMLTAQQRFVSMKTSAADWVLAAGVGGALFVLLVYAAISVPSWGESNPHLREIAAAEARAETPIGLALAGVRVDKLNPAPKGASEEEKLLHEIRREGMSGYLLPFVIISVHLLVVLIGAAYMARTKRRATEAVS